MTRLFHSRDTLTAARLGLATRAVPTCACCGYEQDPDDMAAQTYPGPDLDEAQKHYRGTICTHCFEGMSTCAHCDARRLERDMWNASVCSARCDVDLEYLNYARDERLTFKDVM